MGVWPDPQSPGLGTGVRMHAPTWSLPLSGDQKSSTSQKPRSRGIFHSLFCCVCRDDGEALPTHSGAPLLVEENGAVPKVRGGQVRAAGYLGSASRWVRGKGFFLTRLQALEGLSTRLVT